MQHHMVHTFSSPDRDYTTLVDTLNITCVPTRITGGVALIIVSLSFRMSVGAFLFKELPSTFSHSLRSATD